MDRFSVFFIFLFMLLLAACSGKFNNASETKNEQGEFSEENHSVLLRFSKDEPIYRYEEDNAMEIMFWNNPIKPTSEVNLLTSLPEKIEIPNNMSFVAGHEFVSSGQRIRGFFIDRHPIQLNDLEQFKSKTDFKIVPAAYSENSNAIKKDSLLNLDWETASAYCQWQGKRLPTKAEWTYAFSDKASILPYRERLHTKGKWEWLADWYLPKNQDPYIFVSDADSKKMIVRKQIEQRPIYEWRPAGRKQGELLVTCRCVQDIP